MGIFTKFFGSTSEVAIAGAVERVLDAKLRDTIKTFTDLDAAKTQLSVIEERYTLMEIEIAREKLDLKHKLGLERQRQEQEAEIAKERLESQREAIEAEKDLAVQSARFEAKAEALEETRASVTKMMDRQESMIESLLGALPTAELFVSREK